MGLVQRMTLVRLARRRLHSRTLAILQTAIAALAAWYLGELLVPDPKPVFACVACVVCIGASHGAHRQRALSLVGGVVLGLGLADLIVHSIGTGAPQLALLIVIAMSVRGAAQRLRDRHLRGRGERDGARDGRAARVLAEPHPRGDHRRRRGAGDRGALPPNAQLHVDRAGQAVFAQLGQALESVASALDSGDASRAEARCCRPAGSTR